MTWLKLVEGYMPMQMIFELAFCVGVFALLSYVLNKSGLAMSRFWQGILFWVFLLMYLKYRIYPPIPFSVRAMYGTAALVAVFMWLSSNEEDWKKFKQPILNVLDANTGLHKFLRTVWLVALPLIIGGLRIIRSFPVWMSRLNYGPCIRLRLRIRRCMARRLPFKLRTIRIG